MIDKQTDAGDVPETNAPSTTYFIFATILLGSIGFGLIIPIMPALLEDLTGLETAEATRWGGYVALTYAVMNFFFSPVLGSLSDRFGRRPVLLGSLFMMGVDLLIMAFSTSLWMLFVARMLTGVSGATFATANAYVADTTEPDKRAAAFGMIGAAFGLGFIIGPLLGGVIGHYMGPRAPFFAAAAFAFINVLYGFFVLPESLKPENRRSFDWKRANPIGAFRSVGKVKSVRWILFALFFYSVAHFIYPAIWSYFAKARYAWSELEVGLSLGIFGAVGAFTQAVLIKKAIAVWGPEKTSIFGLASEAITFFLLAITGYGYLALLWIVVGSLGAVTTPALNQIMSSRTKPEEQGELQGAISCMNAMASIISTWIMTELFSQFGSVDGVIYLPGAPFFLASMLAVAGLVVLQFSLFRKSQAKP